MADAKQLARGERVDAAANPEVEEACSLREEKVAPQAGVAEEQIDPLRMKRRAHVEGKQWLAESSPTRREGSHSPLVKILRRPRRRFGFVRFDCRFATCHRQGETAPQQSGQDAGETGILIVNLLRN